MARKPTGRKPRRGNSGNGAASLINALKFVSAAQKKTSQSPFQVHCVFYGGFITAFDGMMTIGHPVEEDIHACPHTHSLLAALLKCGETLSITQLDSGRLSVKSDKFKALVPCENPDVMPYVGPDAPCAIIDDRIKKGFEVVLPLVDDNAARVVLSTVLLQANSIVATNGIGLLEYWHGIDLPPNMLIPKPAAKAIVGTDKKLAKLGFSDNSVTFYFEDGSYIKTQRFEDRYVDYSRILEVPVNPWPLPVEFFIAVDTVGDFSETGLLYFEHGMVRSHANPEQGASYELIGIPDHMAFNVGILNMVRAGFVQVHFEQYPDGASKAIFFNGEIRGALMGARF